MSITEIPEKPDLDRSSKPASGRRPAAHEAGRSPAALRAGGRLDPLQRVLVGPERSSGLLGGLLAMSGLSGVGRVVAGGVVGARTAGNRPAHAPLSVAHIPFVTGPSAVIAKRGNYLRVKVPSGESRSGATGVKRGVIKGFTRQSAARLRALVNQVNQDNAPPHFVTLTYRELADVRGSKLHLERFGKLLAKLHPESVMIWKLEPQKRGAPHFHLIVFGAAGLSVDWVASTWNDIAGGGDDLHRLWHLGKLGRGNRPCVELASSWDRVNRYLTKYCVKLVDSAEWHEPGRFWGVSNRAQLGRYVQLEEQPISAAAAALMERVGRKWKAAGRRGEFVIRFDSCDLDTKEKTVRVWSVRKLREAYDRAGLTDDASFLNSVFAVAARHVPASLRLPADRKFLRGRLREVFASFVNVKATLCYSGAPRWSGQAERKRVHVLGDGSTVEAVERVRAVRPMRTFLIPADDAGRLVRWADSRAEADALELVASAPAAPSVREFVASVEAWNRAVPSKPVSPRASVGGKTGQLLPFADVRIR